MRGCRRLRAIAGLCLALGASAAQAAGNDAVLSQFFSIWDNDARVTPKAVQDFYARRVVYYGQPLTTEQVLTNKRQFIQRWPSRRYAVVPGTSSNTCDGSKARCHVDVTLSWHAESAARGASAGGWTRVSLDLVREDGALKIARESGHRVGKPAAR